MKILLSLLLTFFVPLATWGAKPISTEEFKRITDEAERDRIIEEAPPEQKEELKKADLHMILLERWGGDEGLKAARESQAAAARGVGWLEQLFIGQTQVWDSYVGGVLTANDKAGMTDQKQVEVEIKLTAQRGSIGARSLIVHSLVLNLAASPQALELAKEAERLDRELSKRVVSDGSTPYRPITEEERIRADNQIDRIFEDLKKLPSLTPEQVQREIEAFTDDKIRGGGGRD